GHADRLDRLIMCDTKAVADSPQVKQVRMETAERVLQEGPGFLAELMRDRLFSPTSLRDEPTAVEATQQVIRDTNPRAIAAALYGMAERPDMRDRLPSIDVPSLLIGGELDVISPAEEMRGIAQSMPNAKFIPIPQAGHMAPLERPQEVNSAIREFLSDWV
ncbi:MAG: alpha/beta fold hydrolase, partial [Planctomycetales bacterium]|nr:alpha/beta fold hydrolase [Planctomycetales bacterium]